MESSRVHNGLFLGFLFSTQENRRGEDSLKGSLDPAVLGSSEKPLPPERSFFSIDADNLVLTALKKADQDGAVVLRVFEILGDAAESTIRFLGRERSFQAVSLLAENLLKGQRNVLHVQPYEISTFELSVR